VKSRLVTARTVEPVTRPVATEACAALDEALLAWAAAIVAQVASGDAQRPEDEVQAVHAPPDAPRRAVALADRRKHDDLVETT
jgi:hypothetical protein